MKKAHLLSVFVLVPLLILACSETTNVTAPPPPPENKNPLPPPPPPPPPPAAGTPAIGNNDASSVTSTPPPQPAAEGAAVTPATGNNDAPAGTSTPPLQPAAPVRTNEALTVTPSPTSVGLCQSKTFTVQSKTGEAAIYNWYVNDAKGGAAEAGTITDQAKYTAPKTLPANPAIIIKAQNNADANKMGTASVTLQTMTVTNPRVVSDPKAAGAIGMRPVDSESENVTPQQVVVAGNKLCAVWTDDRLSKNDGDNEIYASCSPAAGGTFGPAVKVNTTTTGDQITPSVTADSGGALYVTWCGPETADKKLHFAKSTNGTSFAETANAINQNKGFSMDPLCSHAVAIGPDNAIYVVAIGSATNTASNGNVGLFCSDDQGQTFKLVTAKLNRAPNDGHNSDSADYPAIAVDTNKNVHIVWDDVRNGARHVYYDKGTRSGRNNMHCDRLTFTDGDTLVSARPNEQATDQDYTATLFWANNTVYVSWVGTNQNSTQNRIYFSKKADASNAFSAGVRVDANPPQENFDQLRPDIVVTPSGLVYISWDDSRFPTTNSTALGVPYLAKSCDGGVTFTPAMNVNLDANGVLIPNPADDIAMTVDPSGSVYLFSHDQEQDTLNVRTLDVVTN